jgi:hypothetical protein
VREHAPALRQVADVGACLRLHVVGENQSSGTSEGALEMHATLVSLSR